MQPTLKLEMFSPPPEQQKLMGCYSPYVLNNILPGLNPNLRHLFAPTTAASYGPNIQMPVQKVYNINLPGPTGGHVEMNKIYENILPIKDIKFSFITLGERLTMYDYIRQILVQINDGEDISLDSDGHRSLMSYIRFMELNPNYYSPLTNNPYKGLPYGLLIYRSCFPIQLDSISHTIVCATESIGLNIRLYSLTIAEYYSYKFRQPIYLEYDVWREIAFYEYVREHILKKRLCPHFPLLYAFFLSPNRKIDFFSLKKGCLTQKDFLTKEYLRFKEVHEMRKLTPSNITVRPLTMTDYGRRWVNKLPDEIDIELQHYSGTTLIAVTEAPHHNLYQWSSRIYKTEGIVRKMVSHGFYDYDVWLGIIFQIVCALYVMQLHGIYLREMTIEDNVYIKDLPSFGKGTGYWKYVIDGIPYFVPNYGYLVLIDSNFKDIIPESKTLPKTKREYKIYTSNIFGKRYALQSVQKKVFENYQRIINPNAFTKQHTKNNVMKPPETILSLLERMALDPETDLGVVISRYFRSLLNNRIGTYLRKDVEIPHLRDMTTPFKQGEMVVEVIAENLYKWAMVKQILADGLVEIITRDTPDSSDFVDKQVRIETLKQYPPTERIEQTFVGTDVNFSEENLLEIYVITK